jgi:uncharacterized ion transporter superfamily protein YfcC
MTDEAKNADLATEPQTTGLKPEGSRTHDTDDELSQGSEELRAFLTSPVVILGLVILTIVSVIIGALITEYGGDRWSAAYLTLVILLGFALRHIIGRNKLKDV